jgi:hypothetical protein
MPLHSEKMLLIEDWTMEVRKEGTDDKLFHFTLSGSKTGPDGEGRSDWKFVSHSGRIAIDVEDWGVAFPMGMSGLKPVPEKFTVKWSVVPWFMDTFQAPIVVDPAVETPVILLQGLANEKHRLELTGGVESRIIAIRVHTPPLREKAGN